MTWDTIQITQNHFYIIFIFLYIFCVRFIYLNTFKIDIIWFAITNNIFSLPLSQIIFLPLILIAIAQFSIILALISFSHTISNLHLPIVRCSYHWSFHLFVEVGWDRVNLGLILPFEYGAALQFFLMVNLLALLLSLKSLVF